MVKTLPSDGTDIGHVEQDHGIQRRRLKGQTYYALHAVLSAKAV